jgi:hypothetical protein
LQIENLKKLPFVNKNWPNDPRIGCKFHLIYWNSLKGMKLLKCKTSINKILFSVKKLFVTMLVIFSLVRKIIKSRFFNIFN